MLFLDLTIHCFVLAYLGALRCVDVGFQVSFHLPTGVHSMLHLSWIH